MHYGNNDYYSSCYVNKTAQIKHSYNKVEKKQAEKFESYNMKKPNYIYTARANISALTNENKQLKKENTFYQKKFLDIEKKIDKLANTMYFVANEINKMKKKKYAIDGFDAAKMLEKKDNKELENNLWEKIRNSKKNENDSEITANILTNSIKLLYNKTPESSADKRNKTNKMSNIAG